MAQEKKIPSKNENETAKRSDELADKVKREEDMENDGDGGGVDDGSVGGLCGPRSFCRV